MAVRVKVVPGASRDRVAGLLGDRLKITVAAPPEDGKANRAVCALLATLLNVPVKSIEVTHGRSQPQKTLLVTGVTLCDTTERLAKAIAK
ncbi:MAG: DUF167 domain-containing protein [Planctomycetes bacterium]|nr:DUF167 domain-containing protein [Planctomycetota bacterium]